MVTRADNNSSIKTCIKENIKKRYKTGILTLLEIRKYQKTRQLLFKKIPFYKLVNLILLDKINNKQIFRVKLQMVFEFNFFTSGST